MDEGERVVEDLIDRRIFIAVCCLRAAIFAFRQAKLASDSGSWAHAAGYEYLSIAQSIAAGGGFSFLGARKEHDHRPSYK